MRRDLVLAGRESGTWGKPSGTRKILISLYIFNKLIRDFEWGRCEKTPRKPNLNILLKIKVIFITLIKISL